jgi:hypothetical protein
MSGQHQPHLGWANGQSGKEKEEEAGSTNFVLDTITSICTYNVGEQQKQLAL